MPRFQRYIGIDYSGRSIPSAPLPGLRAFVADRKREPLQQGSTGARLHWDRQQLASWILDRLLEDMPTIVGIDHAFSYPLQAMDPAARHSWGDFLLWFEARWPTRKDAVWAHIPGKSTHLRKHKHSLRLTDAWTSTAMPILKGFEANGPNVFFSTHAGIPWLRWLRQETAGKVHFWPFDGFEVPEGQSLVAEAYPRIFRRRYTCDSSFSGDERDAWLVCQWLKDRDEKGCLAPYFQPPLDDTETRQALVEGWILGVA